MHKCDCLYRENSRLKEMVSTQPLKAADKEVYEALLSDKDAIIAQKEAKINSLEQRVSYLERQLYGKKAEKFIKPDAQDRWLDFEGFDMLPQEAEAAEEAEKELKATREAIIARKKAGKQHPARKSLPENLEREVVHIYPEGYNPEEWTLLPGEEVTEILMHEPEKFYIRRIVRHTAKRKGTNEFKTGPLPVMPIAKSYASASLLADMMIGMIVGRRPVNLRRNVPGELDFTQPLVRVRIDPRFEQLVGNIPGMDDPVVRLNKGEASAKGFGRSEHGGIG